MTASSRILILVPHPDDEVVGCAAAAFLGIEPVGFHDVPARTLKSRLAPTLARIEAVLSERHIDEVWTPAFEGGHQDHDATNLLASRLKPRIGVVEFAEYHAAGGRVESQRFLAPHGDERHIALTPAEAALKRQALALYRSERRNLAHVRLERECLRPLGSYDYAAAPHAGRLFYARFQWVPFRHPRVDFDPPARVYATLAHFAAETRAAAGR